MTEIQTEWHSHHLLAGYFKQDEFWFDADGNIHKINEMNPHYCLNVLCFLERIAPTVFGQIGDWNAGYPDAPRWLVHQPLYIKIKARVKEHLGTT